MFLGREIADDQRDPDLPVRLSSRDEVEDCEIAWSSLRCGTGAANDVNQREKAIRSASARAVKSWGSVLATRVSRGVRATKSVRPSVAPK